MLDDATLLSMLPFVVVMVIGGLVHGTLGLGFPLVSTPLLALFMDVRSAILVTLLPTMAVNIASIARGGRWRQSIGRFWPLAGFALIGASAGAYVLTRVSPVPFKLALAALVMLYLATERMAALDMAWVKDHLGASMLVFGLIAGFSAGTTNVMVPILIIYTLELGLAKNAMVQVFNLCFFSGKVAQIGVFSATGMFGLHAAAITWPHMAAALAALFIGMRIRDRIPTEVYRRVVRGVLLALAVLLVAQVGLQM